MLREDFAEVRGYVREERVREEGGFQRRACGHREENQGQAMAALGLGGAGGKQAGRAVLLCLHQESLEVTRG